MKKVLGIFVGTHLLLVVLGAAQVNLLALGRFGEWLDLYSQLSGAGSGYGFFSQEITSGLRAEFDVELNGRKITARLEADQNREANLRIGNILSVLSRNVEDEKLRRSLAASWAGKIMAKYPGCEQVTVRMETLAIPPMKEYREGIRNSWQPFYVARFIQNVQPPAVKANP